MHSPYGTSSSLEALCCPGHVARAPDILYLHAEGHLNDYVVPMGALTCLNGVQHSKLGRYAFEVEDDELRRARVIALDLHWAVGFPGFSRLVRHVRAVNPGATLIAGGISAGLWAPRLLDELPLDFVIRGDAEHAFARLTDAVLSGSDPSGIPNVVSRDVREPQQLRMTHADLDATDPVTTRWFPGLERVAELEAEAFSHATTISVTRGCAMRCKTCYGSFADSFGPGHLTRSAESVVRSVQAAREAGVPRLRLFLGKPSPKRLATLTQALADSGPHVFPSEVGLLCCTPPTPEDAERLEAAFPRSVVLSAVHPAEHEPALPKERLAAEWAAWCELGQRAKGPGKMGFEVWCNDATLLARSQEDLRGTPGVRATWAGAWGVTRPTDESAPDDFEQVNDAVTPLWTWSAARVLSPALAALLRPYAWLDDLEADPETVPLPEGALRPAAAMLRARWQEHRLPALPPLRFALATLPRAALGELSAGLARVDTASLCAAPLTWLELAHRHDGVELRAELVLDPGSVACLIASLEPEIACDEAWLSALAAQGLLALDLADASGPAQVSVRLANHEARLRASAGDGTLLAEARRSSGFYRAT